MSLNLNKLIGDVIKFLDGKKTHICAIVLGVTAVLYAHGSIDEMTRDILFATFGTGGIMAFRSGMKKNVKPEEIKSAIDEIKKIVTKK
jgi:hypothetical protein